MGATDIRDRTDNESMRAFMRALLEDVRALEAMMAQDGLFESDVRRIGAEQEMFLVDRGLRPTNRALACLEHLPRESFTTELGQFNLEANLKPQVLTGKCLSLLEAELRALLEQASAAAAAESAKVVLTGILPTLEKKHLGIESMTPIPRYYQLNSIMRDLRGGEFRTYIKGQDELQMTHDNVMLEACNTSFQVHFQVTPREFAHLYNVAQVVTAPVLAAAVNSPVLLRHRLWQETRVALFQQSVDTRSEAHAKRNGRARVSFGDEWIDESVMEIFRDDIARFRVLIATERSESPLAMLERGEIPDLNALRLHNGTVYRWNRPCYGISNGRPHLRIENRVLPAGPTVIDEVANAAFFFGLMCAIADECSDVRESMHFSDAKDNFLAAARYGLRAQFRWLHGESITAKELALRLLPKARAGLLGRGLDQTDVERYLGVLEERVSTGRTGSQWMLDSLEGMSEGRLDERYRALTATISKRQLEGRPVHEWPLAEVPASTDVRESYRTVGQIMTTDLFTVHPEDLIDLAASVMDWEHLRHVPVEDEQGQLAGLVTYRTLLRVISKGADARTTVAVREVMRTDPVTVSPETTTVDAIATMREKRVGCLPVVEDGKLVGIVTENDFFQISSKLLDEWLRED